MSQTSIPYLTILTFLPLVGAVILMLLPRPKDLPEAHGDADHDHAEPEAPTPPDSARNTINYVAMFFALATFVLSVVVFFRFDSSFLNPHLRNMQFLEDHPWLRLGGLNSPYDVHYKMGIDGISLLLILLTTFLMVLCVLFSWRTRQRLKEFMVFLLMLETGMIGVFCALDLVLFYIFWEAMLIPMYFLIGIFGHERRVYAAIKFFIFTFAGSVLMLVAILWIHHVAGTFDLLALCDRTPSGPGQPLSPGLELATSNPQALMWMFAAFSLAFMIKVPMFPFHTWLPDAHVEAPTAGSVILAGVLLKMGTYGFLRFCLPLFPDQSREAAPIFITLAIIGIVYGSLVAAVQPDAKKLVAYSSVAHLGFVILGIFTFTRIGMMGALVQNINHGISTPMLFFLVGMLYERRHTRLISEFGGLKKTVPMLATMLLLATLSSIAVPFFNGFVGEFPVLLGSWISSNTGYWATAVATTGMILSAVYMLWWFQRLMLGPVTKPINNHLPDLSRVEWLTLAPLVVIIFWFGLGSGYWTRRMDTSVKMLLPAGTQSLNTSLPVGKFLDMAEAPEGMLQETRPPMKPMPHPLLTPRANPLTAMPSPPKPGQPTPTTGAPPQTAKPGATTPGSATQAPVHAPPAQNQRAKSQSEAPPIPPVGRNPFSAVPSAPGPKPGTPSNNNNPTPARP